MTRNLKSNEAMDAYILFFEIILLSLSGMVKIILLKKACAL